MTTILVGLSPEACERILELLEAVPTEFDSKIAAELRVAKSHSENPERELQVASEPRKRTSKPSQSKAAATADKMAKAARKAVDTHEEGK